jgi:hypothetical protein
VPFGSSVLGELLLRVVRADPQVLLEVRLVNTLGGASTRAGRIRMASAEQWPRRADDHDGLRCLLLTSTRRHTAAIRARKPKQLSRQGRAITLLKNGLYGNVR